MSAVRRGRDSGGCVLGEVKSVADEYCWEKQRQWRMSAVRRGTDSGGCVLLEEAETVADESC